MLEGRADGVAPKPSQSIETLTRIQRLVAERPTVYLPSHDPQSVARLTARQTAAPVAGDATR
jgi:glyoxylase-like metal-dependent hydrolase (beta-lactamase superfamily II)